jgi:hypothetical protein
MSQGQSSNRTPSTGVTGVTLALNHGSPCYLARCGRKVRQFSIRRLGREVAFRRAVKARAEYELKRVLPAPATREKLRARALRGWADPAERARRTAAIRQMTADDPTLGQRRADAVAPQAHQQAGQRLSRLWQEPDFRAKRLAAIRAAGARKRAAHSLSHPDVTSRPETNTPFAVPGDAAQETA